MGYSLECSNCGLTEVVFYGEGMISKIVANGYCCSCNKFVSITHGSAKNEEGLYMEYDGFKWATMTEEEINAVKEPIGYVYCPHSKTKRALYPCPICGKPFIQIIEEDFGTIENPEKIYCPKCGEKTVEGGLRILWD